MKSFGQINSMIQWLMLSVFTQILFITVNATKIKLTDVEVITLTKDKLTTGRRLNSVPQLKCLSGYIKCNQYGPSVVQCYNRGHDGLDVHWECKSDLDKRVKFGALKVMCEGYDYPNDPYVLAGSCGLEYTLEYINKPIYDLYHKDMYETNKLSNFLTLLIMIVVILAVYKTCTKNRENQSRVDFNQYPPMTNAEYMQTDNNLNNEFASPPPPPYAYDSPPVPNPPGFKPEFSNQQSTHFTTNPSATSNSQASNSNTLGNMLVGAAIGGLGSYLFSGRSSGSRRSETPPPSYEARSGFATTSRR